MRTVSHRKFESFSKVTQLVGGVTEDQGTVSPRSLGSRARQGYKGGLSPWSPSMVACFSQLPSSHRFHGHRSA